jgi:VanZ family protein
MSRKLLKFAAWACLCVIAYSTLSPLGDRPTVLTSSALEHLAAFALLGIVFRVAYPRSTLTVLTIVLGSAGLFELLQLLTPDRHARILDALQKLAGGVAGVFVGCAVLGFDRARFRLSRSSTSDPPLEIRGKAAPRHVSRAIEKAAQIASHIKLDD